MSKAIDRGAAISNKLVAVCGNPNCGKTTIFNALTGLSQKVGNYPGVTVERVSGQLSFPENKNNITIVDIPGTYSLAAFSPDEYIAAASLYGAIEGERLPDAIVCVLEATNLDRSLYLLQQVIQIGVPVLVVLNMIDLSDKKGIKIDFDKLSKQLGGVSVIPVVGNQGRGIPQLKRAISKLVESDAVSNVPKFGDEVEDLINKLNHNSSNRTKTGTGSRTRTRTRARGRAGTNEEIRTRTRAEILRVIFDIDGPAEREFLQDYRFDSIKDTIESGRKKIKDKYGYLTKAEIGALTDRATEIRKSVTKKEDEGYRSKSEIFDMFILNPIIGPILFIVMMVFVFQSIFSWAVPFISFIDSLFVNLAGYVESIMTPGPLQSLLVNGLIGGVGSVLIFIPQIIILFLFISILEDSGYMSRAAFLVDRMFRWCGLSGKSFIPLLSSYACAVPGIMATRTIEDRKQRIITILVAPLMSCSARLPIYTIMIAGFIPYKPIFGIINLQGLVLSGVYVLGLIVAVVVAFILKKTMLKTEKSTFMMEMPSYKVPTFKATFMLVVNRVKMFIIRAGTVILAITIIIWALGYFPRSESINNKYENLTTLENVNFENKYEKLNTINETIIADYPNLDQWFTQINNDISVLDSDDAIIQYRNENSADSIRNLVYNTLLDKRSLVLEHNSNMVQIENNKASENLSNSYFSHLGRFIQPLFEPLGWDWKISMAVLASFPAREVIIATLGTIYNLGGDADEDSASLISKMQQARYEEGEKKGELIFTPAVAMSIMIFFALSCQCGATLVTIRAETGKTSYAVGSFIYMTVLAYLFSFIVFQSMKYLGV